MNRLRAVGNAGSGPRACRDHLVVDGQCVGGVDAGWCDATLNPLLRTRTEPGAGGFAPCRGHRRSIGQRRFDASPSTPLLKLVRGSRRSQTGIADLRRDFASAGPLARWPSLTSVWLSTIRRGNTMDCRPNHRHRSGRGGCGSCPRFRWLGSRVIRGTPLRCSAAGLLLATGEQGKTCPAFRRWLQSDQCRCRNGFGDRCYGRPPGAADARPHPPC